VIALLRARPRAAGPCPGCPLYPHIRDRDLRFPSCELCLWPAVGLGRVHVWRCTSCRHVNEHGSMRPRVSVALLCLATVDPTALLLEVADARCGRYLAPPPRIAHRPRIHRRVGGPGSGRTRPASRMVRLRPSPSGGRPVYARATVAGLPVLIVGGDRPYPHPLGRNEHASGPGSLGNRATRIACPCDQPSPCLHGQALYAHVVPQDAGGGVAPLPLERGRARLAGSDGDRRLQAEAPGAGASLGPVGTTRKVSRSQPAWLTIRAPIGMPAAARADQ
jgi:hypothetical protein